MSGLIRPTVSIQISIDPPVFSPGAPVQLSITATLHASLPITIFTWPTIFHLSLAQDRTNFSCMDLHLNEAVNLNTTIGGKRPGFNRAKGGRDEVYFHTLEPERPKTFQSTFGLALQDLDENGPIIPGHKYRFQLSKGEEIAWWREGRKEDVLAPQGKRASLGDPSGPPIVLEGANAVDFEVISIDKQD